MLGWSPRYRCPRRRDVRVWFLSHRMRGLGVRWKRPALTCLRAGRRAGIAGVLLALLAASGAQAFLYWADTDNYSIGRSSLNGSHAHDRYLSLIAMGSLPCGVAVSARYIYWADEERGAIGRAPISSKGKPNATFITGASLPCGVAVYGDHLYWANKEVNGSIGRANLIGPRHVQESFVPSEQASGGHDLAQPCAVAVGPTGIYWSDAIGGTVGHANLSGTAERTIVSGGLQACGVALSHRYLYWTDQGDGTIGRAQLDGTDPNPTYIAGLNDPCGAVVASHDLYFADGATIDRTDLTSPDPTVSTEQIVAGTRNACGVAVR